MSEIDDLERTMFSYRTGPTDYGRGRRGKRKYSTNAAMISARRKRGREAYLKKVEAERAQKS